MVVFFSFVSIRQNWRFVPLAHLQGDVHSLCRFPGQGFWEVVRCFLDFPGRALGGDFLAHGFDFLASPLDFFANGRPSSGPGRFRSLRLNTFCFFGVSVEAPGAFRFGGIVPY